MDLILEEIKVYLAAGNAEKVRKLTDLALKEGFTPGQIVDESLEAGMKEIEERLNRHEIFIPEVLMASRAMRAAFYCLKAAFPNSFCQNGKVVIGTVAGDLHDVGKYLVTIYLEGAGYEVVDLGTDVSSETFINAIRFHKPDVCAMSTLLTHTISGMSRTIKEISACGLRKNTKIIVGGAPLNDGLAVRIGADGYASDALQAVKLIQELIKKSS